MRNLAFFCSTFAFILVTACDGSAGNDAGPADAATGDAGDGDGGDDAGVGVEDAGPGPDAGGLDAGPDLPCPAPAAEADDLVVYADGLAPAWEMYGFSSAIETDTQTVCTGENGLRYSAGQYDGFQFITDTAPFAAARLSVRVYLDVPSTWTIAAVEPGEEDPHQFIGEEQWQAGWQVLDYPIPATTESTTWILFEKQSEGQDTIWIDDLRLHP